jgi:hypothetical protein
MNENLYLSQSYRVRITAITVFLLSGSRVPRR